MVMGMANLAMVTGNVGRDGRRRQPAARAEQRAGLVRHGLVPARAARLPARLRPRACAAIYEELWGTTDRARAGPAHPQHVRRRDRRHLPRHVRPGRGHRPVRPQPRPRQGGARGAGPARRAGPVPQRDGGVRARVPAGHVVPGEGRHVHQRRAPDQPGAPGDGLAKSASRSGRSPASSRPRWATRWRTTTSREIMDEIAATTPTFAGVSFAHLDEVGSIQWPCNDEAPDGTPIMHVDTFVRGKGRFVETAVRADRRAHQPQVPADPHDRPDPVPVQRRARRPGAPRTSLWHDEDVLEIHPHDAEDRGITDGATVRGRQPGRRDAAARAARPTGCRRASSTRRSTTRSAAPTS